MAAADPNVIVRTSEPPKLRVGARLRELMGYREILANLVRKELKVKYTASVLGALWSMANPIVFLIVFTFVSILLGNDIPYFPVYLLSGLLAWNLFSNSLNVGVRSVIDNSNLVKKVYFPREVLPLSAIGSSMVDFVAQILVLLLFMLIFRYPLHLGFLILMPLSILALLVFTTAMCFLVAAVNVRYRDMQHLLSLALLVWFWFTPIVYPSATVQDKLSGVHLFGVYLVLNPLADIVIGLQRALYGVVSPVGAVSGRPVTILADQSGAWVVGVLIAVIAGSLGLLYLTWRLFFRLSGDFAEEL